MANTYTHRYGNIGFTVSGKASVYRQRRNGRKRRVAVYAVCPARRRYAYGYARQRRFPLCRRVYPDKHYVVARAEEVADFIERIKDGRYIVLFAPRQTGKTTFFRLALEAFAIQDST